jgi:hypothetical protein
MYNQLWLLITKNSGYTAHNYQELSRNYLKKIEQNKYARARLFVEISYWACMRIAQACSYSISRDS